VRGGSHDRPDVARRVVRRAERTPAHQRLIGGDQATHAVEFGDLQRLVRLGAKKVASAVISTDFDAVGAIYAQVLQEQLTPNLTPITAHEGSQSDHRGSLALQG
jgi:hypothetical protein